MRRFSKSTPSGVSQFEEADRDYKNAKPFKEQQPQPRRHKLNGSLVTPRYSTLEDELCHALLVLFNGVE